MDEIGTPSHDGEGVGGSVPDRRDESGRSIIQNGRLEERAIRKGWIKSKRWPTNLTLEEFQQKVAGGQATFLDRALITAQKLMNSSSERANGIGMRAIMTMEAQNQGDDHRPDVVDPGGNGASPFGCEVPLDQIAREMAASVPTSPPEEEPEYVPPPTEEANADVIDGWEHHVE